MVKKEDLPACPVATTVQLIGSKWKLLIIRNLMERPYRFNELQKSLEGISQKVLTENLRSMENDGIVSRRVYEEVPPRVEYALTELGVSMRPILDAMAEWGNNYKKTLQIRYFLASVSCALAFSLRETDDIVTYFKIFLMHVVL